MQTDVLVKSGTSRCTLTHLLGRLKLSSRAPKILNEQINAFITEFSSVAASLGDSNNELIIAGDFNINLLKIKENDVYSNFFDTLISHSLYPQITLPTRFTRTNGILIDNYF